MTFRATAVLPAPPHLWMPTVEAYMALAEALHDASDLCAANYEVTFAECDSREGDIIDAIRVLIDLHADGWQLVRDPGATAELGL